MRIDSLNAKNFLGLASFSAKFPQGLTLLVGPNGAGKSSVLESIRFALLGERVRGVRTKADLKHLVSQGATEGAVSITVDGYTYRRAIKTGECSTSGPPHYPAAISCVLDASHFAAMPEPDRRKFLFELMQVESSHTAIAELLDKAGVAKAVIDEVLPILRTGFDGAEKYSTDQAAQARGAWKAITGEAYGDKKAEGWEPKASDTVTGEESDEVLQNTAALIPELEQQHADALKDLGVAEARETANANPDLAKAREKLPTWLEKREIGTKKEADLVQQIKALELVAHESGGVYQPCPCCNEMLLLDRGVLTKAHALSSSQVEAAKNLSEKRAELETTRTALTKINSNIRIAQGLIADAEATGAGDVGALTLQVQNGETELRKAKLARETMQIRQREREQAMQKTEAAAVHHRAVQDWKLCAEQLSPSGIPATLLAQALGPINLQLQASADFTEWSRVEIQPDMRITYAGRSYSLCSESERWRADAMIGDAIARLSGLNLLVLDRFDVLDQPGRSAAMAWLLEVSHELETVIVGATLKQAPAIEGANVIWLSDELCGRSAVRTAA